VTVKPKYNPDKEDLEFEKSIGEPLVKVAEIGSWDSLDRPFKRPARLIRLDSYITKDTLYKLRVGDEVTFKIGNSVYEMKLLGIRNEYKNREAD
jgi:hypothetical protein